jgi:hypothetical protein
MYELSLIRSLLDKDTYNNYRHVVELKEFSPECRLIVKSLDKWWQTEEGEPTLVDIANLTFAQPIPEKERGYIKELFHQLEQTPINNTAKELLRFFKQQQVCKDLALVAYEASIGRKSIDEVASLASKLKEEEQPNELLYVSDNLQEIINQHIKTPGLRWRLKVLNQSLGSLRKGDFGFVFARPETGKTTFLSSEITNMTSQLGEYDGPIIWFNNEESGEDVKFRNFLSALGWTKEQVLSNPEAAQEQYIDLTHGKLLLYDNAFITKGLVESLCKKEQPSLIVIDQIDKVKGFTADRKDLELGAIYQWGRELAKTYCPVIGICQADGSGEGVRWLQMNHVADAKTAKQAEADFIIGIGKDHAQGFEFVRFLHILKNKLTGDMDTDPNSRHGRFEVLIKPEIGRYEDL